MEELKFIGTNILRPDAQDKVRGKTQYTGDLKFPGMLYARLLRSPLAHAYIRKIDTRAARRIPGVKTIVLGKDYPFRFGGSSVRDTPILAWEKVLYHGEPVAAVVATDDQAAQEAIDRIETEFEPLPGVFDPVSGMEPDAPVLHPDLGSYTRASFVKPVSGTNICTHAILRTGDVKEGFRVSDRIYENSYRIPSIQHASLESHVTVSQADGSGRVTLWASTQSPYLVRSETCDALGWDLNRLRVIVPPLGGGFGGKDFPRLEPLATVLALEAKGQPVRLWLDRDEEFLTKVRPALVSVLKTGVKRDGSLVALEAKLHFDNGAYADFGPAVARASCFSVTGPYRIPHVMSDAYLVYTNTPPAGSFRGFGVPEIAWGYESQMDIIAADLGIDPVEFRLKNGLEEGDESPTGETMHSVGMKECLRRVSTAMAWGPNAPKRKGVGRGIAAVHKSTGTPASSSIFIKMNEDGKADLLTSGVDMGQGLKTVLSQIAAEELGLTPDAVRVSFPDTGYTPYERTTTGSRATFLIGNSTRKAAAEVRKQMLAVASQILEAPPGDLMIQNSKIWVKGEEGRSITVGELWKGGLYSRGQYPLLGGGACSTADVYQPIDPATGRSARPTTFWMYVVQGVDVAVDEETGKIAVTRIVSAHDVGKAIHPLNCEGQIEGAVVMGIGSALMEGMVFENGQLSNSDWSSYRIPTALDIPTIVPLIVEATHPDGPFGAKGLGEPGVGPIPPCIGNALFDATGIRVFDLPLTHEKIYWALKKRRVPQPPDLGR
jgi:carbon-monoxide dehydrogenase large subunit